MNTPNVDDAIVRFPLAGGRGVLVGEIILTAAHCVSFKTDGSMIVGGYIIEEIETRHRDRLKVRPLAVEPVADIAVLGCLDAQVFPDEARAFEEYRQATTSVCLARRIIPAGNGYPIQFPISVLNANGQWTNGEAELFDESGPFICIAAESEIEGGSSGGPILNEHGELVAIVSHSSRPTPGVKSSGDSPRPLQALPVWICEKYLR